MAPTPAALERAMKFKEVVLQAIDGQLTWWQAAEILGISPRTMRRWRWRFLTHGVEGLQDRRRVDRSPHKVPEAELARWLRLYRTRYAGYNARHFYACLKREPAGCLWSYSVVLRALQAAGLLKKKRPRGRHWMRREPRACFGEMLHIDGSRHRWLTLRPDEWQSLIVVVDDATKKILYAQLFESETTQAILTALHQVVHTYGIPQALYSDRASWATVTRLVGQRAERSHVTQVGRALEQLGVEHILAYSPQARGRSERANRTLQDRLVKELATAGIRTPQRANRYIEERFLPAYNEEFGRAPAHPDSGFAPAGPINSEAIFCEEETRLVHRDNTVVQNGHCLQITRQPGRASCAGLKVTVRTHLDQTYTIWLGSKLLGRYSAQGRALSRETIVHPAQALIGAQAV
jgi:hypothetical protein